jgi:subtilisin family serine protease
MTSFQLQANTEIKQNTPSILITVIDTGIDLKNSELTKFLWTNPGESGLDKNNKDKATNGIDDDLNGFIDDIHGWNFVTNTSDVQDHHGHGTHVTSLIINNLKKLNKENYIKIQIVKYFHADNDTHNILKASNNSFKYAAQFNPTLINYSGGGYTASAEEKSILNSFANKETLIITASGNQNNNNDVLPYYPASYNFPFVISVGSIDANLKPSKFSNYGSKSVDFFALGERAIGFTLNNQLAKLSGTSQATANLSAYATHLIIESQITDPESIHQFLCEQTKSISKNTKASTCGKIILLADLNKFKGKTFDSFGLIGFERTIDSK